MKPLDPVLPLVERDRIRARELSSSGWYSPWLHLATTSVSGVGLAAAGLAVLHEVHPWELAFAAGLALLGNAIEWHLHRDVLHQRRRGATILYDRHTPIHHRVYVTDDMAVRSAQELRLVLLPAYAMVAVFVGTLPVMGALWALGQHNLAGLFAAVSMLHVVTYEWLHLSFHLPTGSFAERVWPLRSLRRHHAIHHDPRLMQRWNFNVTLPLWDLLRRTTHPSDSS